MSLSPDFVCERELMVDPEEQVNKDTNPGAIQALWYFWVSLSLLTLTKAWSVGDGAGLAYLFEKGVASEAWMIFGPKALNSIDTFNSHVYMQILGTWDNNKGAKFCWTARKEVRLTSLKMGIRSTVDNARIQKVSWIKWWLTTFTFLAKGFLNSVRVEFGDKKSLQNSNSTSNSHKSRNGTLIKTLPSSRKGEIHYKRVHPRSDPKALPLISNL